MMNLHEMAVQKQLPAHQFMDRGTLEWIEATARKYGLSSTEQILLPISLADCMNLASPSPTFFINKQMACGLHGFRHCARVAILAGLLAAQEDSTDSSFIRSAMVAGSLHDCRRENDNADEGHGVRSAEWFTKNVHIVQQHFEIAIAEDDQARIEAAIHYHEASDEVLREIPPEFRRVVDIIKAADALDRYRQPKETWWINDEYLNLKPSAAAKQCAFALMYCFEDAFLQIDSNDLAFAEVKRSVKYV